MSVQVRYKLTNEEYDIVGPFAAQLGLSLEQLCKQALFYSIQDSHRRAVIMQQQMQEQEQKSGKHNTEPGNTSGVGEEALGQAGDSSGPLAIESTVPSETTSGSQEV